MSERRRNDDDGKVQLLFKFGFPSLVCDFQELYRYLIDDFIIQYSQELRKMDFRKNKKGDYANFHPRIYLTEEQHTKYKNSLHSYFRQNSRRS